MKIRETNIEVRLFFVVIVMILAFVIPLCCSCSVQKTWSSKEKELCTPQLNTIKIIWCDENKVYYIDEQGNKGWFKNRFKENFYVGDIYFKKF
jgi:hypothetical protein